MCVCVCARLTVAVMLLLSSMIAAEYLLEGMAVALDWSRVCADSFSNLQHKNTRQFPSASRPSGTSARNNAPLPQVLGQLDLGLGTWSLLRLYQSSQGWSSGGGAGHLLIVRSVV